MEEEVKYLRMRTIGSGVGKAWEVPRPKYQKQKKTTGYLGDISIYKR